MTITVPTVVQGLGVAPVLVNNIIQVLADPGIVLVTTTGGVCSGKTSMGDDTWSVRDVGTGGGPCARAPFGVPTARLTVKLGR